MFAVVEVGGSQYRVEPKETIEVNKVDADAGKSITLDKVVLVAASEKDAKIGQPYVSGAKVEAKVVEHFRGDKVIVFKKKAKNRYERKQGHRQDLTKLEITNIKA